MRTELAFLTSLGTGGKRCLTGRARHGADSLHAPVTVGAEPFIILQFHDRVTKCFERFINLSSLFLGLREEFWSVVKTVWMPDLSKSRWAFLISSGVADSSISRM